MSSQRETELQKLKALSAFSLPNSPTQSGYTPEQIRAKLYQGLLYLHTLLADSREDEASALTAGLATKQDVLIGSGTNQNIKTVNDNSLVGSGNVAVQPILVGGTNIKNINSQSIVDSGNINLQTPLEDGVSIKKINGVGLLGSGNISVQEPLVSGTNIKTVNGKNILGSGGITIDSYDIQFDGENQPSDVDNVTQYLEYLYLNKQDEMSSITSSEIDNLF